ncbi:Flagellar basal-body rod protein FlgF [Planctomycetes bacterium Poly30]|uniref:Flagellar basal-body rod protein FlgF n=1 Tax=Saltatorellus ferox TaxID=2528018 RepID=A0A518F0W2_9BACT|nr:Flagellar basal-body rod protein FlgF [Planctomycetes bacterium Poly30]
MNIGLYRTVAAMRTNQQRVEIVSSNIANTETTGFKRMLHVAHGAEGWGRDAAHQQVVTGTRLDMDQGVLQRTGEDLDLALDGKGFFVVDGLDGELLTRQGQFQLTDTGVLVSRDGQPVQWSGQRGVLDTSGVAIKVDNLGNVTQGSLPVGRLRVVDVLGVDAIEPNDVGSYRVRPGAEVVESDASVNQGFVERANVQTVDELVELIAAQRAFDSAAQAFRTIDQSYRRLHQ